MVKATPLIFTGLACSVAFRMRLWNIGAEGQLMMGAWGASAIVLLGWLPEGTPSFVYLPLMMLAGIGMGALWAGIAGWLKARLNVNEIITTLMLVYICQSGSSSGSSAPGATAASRCRPASRARPGCHA